MQVKEKIVIVTGGAQGIGHKIAEKFLENEAKVVIILDIDTQSGSATEKELSNRFGKGRAVFIECDVTKELDKVSTEIISTYKTVDVLVNNAGWVRENSIRDTLELNVTALIEWSMRFFEHMRTDAGGKGGTIINISSIYGYRKGRYAPFYAAAKHAVLGFTKSKGHIETCKGSGVRMLTICPGFAKTNLITNAKVIDKNIEEYMKAQLWQDPVDIAEAVVEVFKKAESGTAWLIEGGNPVQELKHLTSE